MLGSLHALLAPSRGHLPWSETGHSSWWLSVRECHPHFPFSPLQDSIYWLQRLGDQWQSPDTLNCGHQHHCCLLWTQMLLESSVNMNGRGWCSKFQNKHLKQLQRWKNECKLLVLFSSTMGLGLPLGGNCLGTLVHLDGSLELCL